MEVETAVRKRMLLDSTVQGYVVGKVFKFRLEEKVDGTGGMALVVQRDGGWGAPVLTSASEYPTVWIRAYADPTRDPVTKAVKQADAADKAFALFRAADRVLHGARGVVWGGDSGVGLQVVSCARQGEPFVVTDSDMHGRQAGGSAQGLSTGEKLGDAVYVTAPYAMNVFH